MSFCSSRLAFLFGLKFFYEVLDETCIDLSALHRYVYK
jgi:hypothetical protein